MTYYFQEHQWEPYVYNRLNQLIDHLKQVNHQILKRNPMLFLTLIIQVLLAM